ncbi:hypothetical protein GC194_02675 [bacterium]|nr:hypothetical protein [bacterium]
MLTTKKYWYGLVFFTLLSLSAFARKSAPGYLVTKTGDTLKGMVKYRRLDVALRVVLITSKQESTSKEIFGPEELKSFVYGNETWLSIDYSKAEIGWTAAYFAQVIKEEASGLMLLYGSIISEGCHCSGTKNEVRNWWILYNHTTGQKTMIVRGRFGHVKRPEWARAFFMEGGFDLMHVKLKSVDDLKRAFDQIAS